MVFQRITAKQFLALLCMVLSLALLSSGLVTWVASNWQSISPNYKILLVQAILLLIAVSLLILRLRLRSRQVESRQYNPTHYWWYQGLAFLGAVVSGALIALVGQIYQTGADTWQLFALWFLLILPWFAFSANVFIAALAAVVVNTAMVLFLMGNQLLISQSLATYLLAFLNTALFVLLEQKRARYESLWAVLSTCVLICAVAIFAMAEVDTFDGSIAFHLLVAAALLTVYVKLSSGPLRLKVLIITILAASVTSYILETASSTYWGSYGFAWTLLQIGMIWVAAAFAALWLWRKQFENRKESSNHVATGVLPISITVFLSLSSVLAAFFVFLAFYLGFFGGYEHDFEAFRTELALSCLVVSLLGIYLTKHRASMAYAFIVLYEVAVFISIEKAFSTYYFTAFGGLNTEGLFSAVLLPLSGLVTSILIYRKRSEVWLRFISALGLFVFLGLLTRLPFIITVFSEVTLLPLLFMGVMWWGFKRPDKVSLSLFAAFVMWALYVVVSNYYQIYMMMYFGGESEHYFRKILLAFLQPFKYIFIYPFKAEELGHVVPVLEYLINAFHWLIVVLYSFVPLWALLQISKHQGATIKTVAVLMGLLVAWLWSGRMDVLIPLSMMLLGYHLKSRALYYSAVVLGLLSMSMFYFSLMMPLTHKAYLLLLSGGLFMLIYLAFAKKLLLGDEGTLLHADSALSQLNGIVESIKHRIVPSSQTAYYGLLVLAVVLPIATSQWQVHSYERTLESGKSVLLRLQPVDPRSLMQGDYMVISYEISSQVRLELRKLLDVAPKGNSDFLSDDDPLPVSEKFKESLVSDSGMRLFVEVSLKDGVAEKVLGFYDSEEVAALEIKEGVVYLPFVAKNFSTRHGGIVSPRFSTEFFFNEERAKAYEEARFAEVVVTEGRVMLKALLDIDRNMIDTATGVAQ